MIRVLVADDQPMARDRLLSLIRAEPDMEVAGTATSGPEAVVSIREGSPDLVFLDMQMPGMNGFDVMTAVGLDRMPPTIFVTAYDEHAVRAFDVQALDYLLKPFGRQRFQAAMARARKHLVGAVPDHRAGRPPDGMAAPPESPDRNRLIVKSDGRVNFVDVCHIDWVEAQGNYIRIHAGSEVFVMRETMTGIGERLGSRHFARVHRKRIVNLRRVKQLQLGGGGEYHLVLWSGATIALSRTYRDAVKTHLSGP